MEYVGLILAVAALIYFAGLKANAWQALVDHFAKKDDADKK